MSSVRGRIGFAWTLAEQPGRHHACAEEGRGGTLDSPRQRSVVILALAILSGQGAHQEQKTTSGR